MEILKAIGKTLDVNKGGGMKETIQFVVMVVAIVTLMVLQVEVPSIFYLILGVSVGLPVGSNIDKKKGDENE